MSKKKEIKYNLMND